MPQSLKAATFDYTDEGRWSSYFDTQLRNFAEEAKALYEFRQELVRKCDGMPYDELQEQWDYSQVLLGGVGKNGDYRERSLAKLYNELLGLRFENLKDVVEKQRQDISPSTKVVVDDTPFATFVAGALDKAETALQQAQENDVIYNPDVETECDFYDLLSDQENFSQLLSDFIYRLQGILPNYDKKALFMWTLDKTTNRYLSIAYPKLKDREPWGWLDETFGLESVFVSEIDETGENVEDREQQYTVYAYRNGSLGDTLVDLYRLVWGAFDSEVRESLQLVFLEVPNFKQEFIDDAYDSLDQIGWTVPDSLNVVGESERYSGNRGDTTKAEYHISGITLDSCNHAGYSTSGNQYSNSEDCNLSLLRILDDLAPGLFLLNGLKYELDINHQSLEVEKL